MPLQRRHKCGQRCRVNRACDPHPSLGRELNLERLQQLPIWRNGDCRKTDPVILPLHWLRPASEDARARLSPPDRKQTAVNVMSLGNLDNTGPRRQTLFHDPM